MVISVVKGKVLGFGCYHGNSSSNCRKMKKIKLMELSIGLEYGCGCYRSNIVAAIAAADHNL